MTVSYNQDMDFTDQFNRLQRAQQQGAELAKAIQDWRVTSIEAPEAKIAEDRLSWELVLHVKDQASLGQWGLQFGEAIHNLRSTLDNLAVSIARQSGVTSRTRLRDIYFPICRSEEDWNRSGRPKIAGLPDVYLTAIEQIQPFQRLANGGSLDEDGLLVLSSLNNEDKHHLQVKPVVHQESIQHNTSIEFEDEEGASASIPPDTEVFACEFKDGQPLLRQRTQGRIAKVKGSFDISAQVQVVLRDGREVGLLHILAMLCQYTEDVVKHIAAVRTSSQL